MKLEEIALNIKRGQSGVYYVGSDSTISYPDDGNLICMQIEEDSFWFRHRNDIIAECIKKHSTGKRFLDVGGGNGFVAKRLQDEGFDVVLIEPGKIGAQNAYKRGIKYVIYSTLEKAAFVPNSIDAVGLFDTLEHIEDDEAFLHHIHKIMRPNGLLYITVPAFNFLWSNEDDDAGHYKRYTTRQLTELLKKCGLTIVVSTYFFCLLPLPILLFRTIPSKLGLNRNSTDIKRHKNQHKMRPGFISYATQKIWLWELSRIKKDKRIPFGASCFVIGKKEK